MTDKTYILAIDQGTTSSRAMIFDRAGEVIGIEQMEHDQIFPQAGWVEHDAAQIWENTNAVIGQVLESTKLTGKNIAAVGITNQRETAVVWDKRDGKPVHNAIVWQDTRTQPIVERLGGSDGKDKYKKICGLPLATYFSGPKITWILENDPKAAKAAKEGHLLFGTTDSWVLWNLTGGAEGGVHATDVTNASRTMLMDLRTLKWDEKIAADMSVPLSMLPEIKPSSGLFGECAIEELKGVPVSGILGDQQAATFGQACLTPGSAKNTYGTGNFMLLNTGTEPVTSENGLLTTLCYQIGDEKPVYALEGSIAVTGSLVQWVRDNLGLISQASEIEKLAGEVEDNGGVYFVPAFSGLFAPHWRPDARGAILGLTRFANKSHLARAVLESVAFQTREVMDAMQADAERTGSGRLTEMRVDGGMVENEMLMQFQADLLGVDVVRPTVSETTALGAAYAAGLSMGYWASTDEITENWGEDKRWKPAMDDATRERLLGNWRKAVSKTLDWVTPDTVEDEPQEKGAP